MSEVRVQLDLNVFTFKSKRVRIFTKRETEKGFQEN